MDFFYTDFLKKYNIQYSDEYLKDDDKQNLIYGKYKGALYNKKEFYDEENNKKIITCNICSNRQTYIEFKDLLNSIFCECEIKDSPVSCFPHNPNLLATGIIIIYNHS